MKELDQQKTNWKNFVTSQKSLFDDFFYENYLKSCEVLEVDKGRIIVSVPSEYTKKTLLEKFVDKSFANNGLDVVFVVSQNWTTKKNKNSNTKEDEFTFANLVVGNFNKGVVQIAWKILAGENVWTPFFVYSEPGLGKTHILKAIKNEAEKMNKKCYYIHANTFGSLLLKSFSEGSSAIENLKNSFHNQEIILFDDVQLLARREKTNEVLFQIFCNVIDQKKQIVFTSDQHPEELSGFEKRLKSRFVNGLNLKIGFPDQEVATKIVEKKALKILGRNINKVSPETIKFIAKFCHKDVRKIEGTIKQIKFHIAAQETDQEFDLLFFKKVFGEQGGWTREKISAKTIQKETAKLYRVPYSVMVSGSRKAKVVKARGVAMYLIRELTDEGFASISAKFGSKNHATAINAIKKIAKNLKESAQLQKEIGFLKKVCEEK